MSEVTSPILTDATGQEIVSKLNTLLTKMDNLAAAFQPNASGIVYSNTTSGLTGDDVQEAIDEMAGDVSEINSALSLFNIEELWTGSKYTTGNITMDKPIQDGDSIELWFKGLSSVYIQQFPIRYLHNVTDKYQIGFWGDSTQYARYRITLTPNSTTFSIDDVINGNTGSALIGIYRTRKAS